MNLLQKIKEVKDLKDISDEVMKDISDEVMNMIDKIGITTGSSAWGVNTINSDVDVIIRFNDYMNWEDIMKSGKGVYLHGDKYNGILHYIQEDL